MSAADWGNDAIDWTPVRPARGTHRYQRIAYQDRAGQDFSASIPPMTAAQLIRHLRERLCCPHVTIQQRRGRYLALTARWPDLTRRGIVAVGQPKR